MSSQLAKIVFLEISPRAEEQLFDRTSLMRLIFCCRQFDSANEIRHLKEPIILWFGVFIDNCILGQCILKRRVKNLRNKGLTVVVINFNRIEYLEFL